MKLPLNQELALRFDSLYQWLSRKYQLELVEQDIAGHTYRIYKITNIDHVLDKLIENSNQADENAPYWAEIWPSAIALGEFFSKMEFEEKRALGLGSGVGVAEMAAKPQGANVVLSDNQEDALRIAELNWMMNFNESPQIFQLDWRSPQRFAVCEQPNIGEQFDILIASDVAYEQRLFWPLSDTFQKLLKPGGEIYLSEPNRTIAKEFFDLLKKQGFEFERSNQRIFYKERETDISVYRIWRKS